MPHYRPPNPWSLACEYDLPKGWETLFGSFEVAPLAPVPKPKTRFPLKVNFLAKSEPVPVVRLRLMRPSAALGLNLLPPSHPFSPGRGGAGERFLRPGADCVGGPGHHLGKQRLYRQAACGAPVLREGLEPHLHQIGTQSAGSPPRHVCVWGRLCVHVSFVSLSRPTSEAETTWKTTRWGARTRRSSPRSTTS